MLSEIATSVNTKQNYLGFKLLRRHGASKNVTKAWQSFCGQEKESLAKLRWTDFVG